MNLRATSRTGAQLKQNIRLLQTKDQWQVMSKMICLQTFSMTEIISTGLNTVFRRCRGMELPEQFHQKLGAFEYIHARPHPFSSSLLRKPFKDLSPFNSSIGPSDKRHSRVASYGKKDFLVAKQTPQNQFPVFRWRSARQDACQHGQSIPVPGKPLGARSEVRPILPLDMDERGPFPEVFLSGERTTTFPLG